MSELLNLSIKNTKMNEFEITVIDIHPDSTDVALLENGEYTSYSSLETYSLGLLLELANGKQALSSFIKEYGRLDYIDNYGELDDDYSELESFDPSFSVNSFVVPELIKSAELVSTKNPLFWDTAMQKHGDDVFEEDQRDNYISDFPTAIIKIILHSSDWDSAFNDISCDSAFSVSL
jgi:hypothetical protein